MPNPKKRMLVITGTNVMVNADLDALLYLIADEWECVPYTPDMLSQVGEYDATLVSLSNGLSERQLRAVALATRPGRIFVKEVDIQFGTRPFPALDGIPVVALATLHSSIEGTDADREMRRRWMARFHPDSQIRYVEYLVGLVHTIGPDIRAAADKVKSMQPPEEPVRAFYWGIKRPGVYESLIRMGFGSDERDALFGAIGTQFHSIRDLSAKLTKDEKFIVDHPQGWGYHAAHAEQVLLPYEPIKSEYQITRRLLECAFLAGDRTVVDDRISDHVARFLDPEEWYTYADEVKRDLLAILDEGLVGAGDEAGEYGPQVGTEHGDLLRWVLDSVDLGDGWAVEFGTGDGTSTKAIAAKRPVMTFDHFGGLPERWRDGFERGMFAQKRIPNIPGAVIVNGLFSDTLPVVPLPDKVALLHVDCDLYSSTATVFERAKDLIQPGTVIVFDELIRYPGWEDHEHRAWVELKKRWRGLKVEPLGWAHEAVAYRVVSCGGKRTATAGAK